MNDRSHLLTEQRLAESMRLDAMSIEDAVALMNQQDRKAVAAVGLIGPQISQAVELVVAAMKVGGRLIYVGAGTSGRLGVLDASECPPTFRIDPSRVVGVIAGGPEAVFRSQEGAEDSAEGGAQAMNDNGVDEKDVVVGIASGGTTPFVHGALHRAKQVGAKTVFLSCVQAVPNEPVVNVVLRPLTGPEVLTGSTRLKAGTATKLILNTISTIAMVQLGKVYENLMVDLQASNSKLWERAARNVSTITGLDREAAVKVLQAAGGHVKLAVVMQKRGVSADAARELLEKAGGKLREAVNEC